MSLFTETLHKLAIANGLSYIFDGEEPTTETEFNEIIEWRSDDKITWAEVQSEMCKAQRAAEYPSIEEQLDTLYHGGLTEWKATIKAVKDKYPKE
jgi:hypothetical protein